MYKFRGKRLDNGEWVYGDRLGFGDLVFIVIDNSGFQRTSSVQADHALISGCCEVHPDSVGMWTGIEDYYGDDIVESKDGKRRYIITYREMSAKYVLAGIGKAWWIHDMQPAIVDMIVIGNTTDNPELLGE